VGAFAIHFAYAKGVNVNQLLHEKNGSRKAQSLRKTAQPYFTDQS